MQLLLFLVFGLVVGVIARLIVPGRQAGGWIASLVIGVLGSFLGGYLGAFLGMGGAGRPSGFLMSIIGAVILVVAYHALTKGRATV